MTRRSSEISPVVMAKEARELKNELQKLVNAIIEEDDYGLDIAEEAIRILSALKELKFRKLISFYSKGKGLAAPEEFLCPISGELMKDPVLAVASGETYDRQFIMRWFSEVSMTCPKTKKILYNTELTSNHLVQNIIASWCEEHGVENPKLNRYQDEEAVEFTDRTCLDELLEEMSSSSLSDQKQAAKELRKLTSAFPHFREIFIEFSEDIFRILNPLLSGSANVDPSLREDLVTTIFNISIPLRNKIAVAECPAVLPILNESLLYGTIESRSNAAAALGSLAQLNSNRALIENSGALKNLIILLKEGYESAISNVTLAIFFLCMNIEIRNKAVEEGLIWVMMEKIMDRVHVGVLVSMLAKQFVYYNKAAEEMTKLGAVPLFFDLIRDSSWNVAVKENCIAIILVVCMRDGSQWKHVEEEESRHGTLSALADGGPSETMKNTANILWNSMPGSSDMTRSS